MNRSKFLTLLLAVLCSVIYGQDSTFLRQNAIKIEKRDSLDDDIYKAISAYQLIMVGEMHGSNEPAQFVLGLTTMLTKKGKNVQVGLEIPSEQMGKFLAHPDMSNIYSSDFFSKRNYNIYDLRASYAWADLISKLTTTTDVEIFFHEASIDDATHHIDRDSSMYLQIKKRIQLHPTWMTITLGGNIHNRLKPYSGKKTMGLYLFTDNDLAISSKTLSICHLYSTGRTWSNADNVVELIENDFSDSIFSRSLDYDSYFVLLPADTKMAYSAVYFTRKITPSNLVAEKNIKK